MIFLPFIGYFLVIIHDLTLIYKVHGIIRIISYTGYPLTLTPIIFIPLAFDQSAALPAAAVLWTAAGLFGVLLVFSSVIEPIRFSMESPGTACRKGTYRFSRHPGWIWFTALNCLYAVIFPYPLVFILLACCTLANLLVIWLEDRYLFPKVFWNYHEYKAQVPFLL